MVVKKNKFEIAKQRQIHRAIKKEVKAFRSLYNKRSKRIVSKLNRIKKEDFSLDVLDRVFHLEALRDREALFLKTKEVRKRIFIKFSRNFLRVLNKKVKNHNESLQKTKDFSLKTNKTSRYLDDLIQIRSLNSMILLDLEQVLADIQSNYQLPFEEVFNIKTLELSDKRAFKVLRKKVSIILEDSPTKKIAVFKISKELNRLAEFTAQEHSRINVSDAIQNSEYSTAKASKVIEYKIWNSVFDLRVRETHARLNRKIKKIDEPFLTENGSIMFPLDPSAPPSETNFCRCVLQFKI